jgi:hypothetical protein
MLAEAKELAKAGRAVYIIAASKADARDMEFMAGDEMRDLGIKIECPASLITFDWERMRLRVAHPNCVVLVDHYAIESRYASLLRMLHRWDSPPEENL